MTLLNSNIKLSSSATRTSGTELSRAGDVISVFPRWGQILPQLGGTAFLLYLKGAILPPAPPK